MPQVLAPVPNPISNLTSDSYKFRNITVDAIIKDAFQQIGVNPSLISGLQYTLAQQALNTVLTSWLSKRGTNLFTVEQDILPLNPGQSIYKLPDNTSRVLEAILINTNLVLFNTNSSFYNANLPTNLVYPLVYQSSNVFTPPLYATGGEPLTGKNGWYFCNFGITNPLPLISMIGITTAGNQKLPLPSGKIQLSNTPGIPHVQYTLAIQYMQQPDINSAPPVYVNDYNWQTALITPTTNYYAGITKWFALPYQINSPFIRILSIGDNDSILNLQSVQFLSTQESIPMQAIGRDVFTKIFQNQTEGVANSYYINRSKVPTVSLYPTPNSNYQFMLYNRVRMIQDIGKTTNTLDISSRYIGAAVSGLAAYLSKLYAPDKLELLNSIAAQDFEEASMSDVEGLPLQISLKNR